MLGRRDRNGQRLTFGHIQFTMAGSPSRPILNVDRLGDREVGNYFISLHFAQLDWNFFGNVNRFCMHNRIIVYIPPLEYVNMSLFISLR